MKRASTLISVATLAAIVVVSLAYIASLGVRFGRPSNTMTATMAVDDVNSLVVGSSVLLRGVPIGKVSEIETNASNARVTFYYDKSHRIPIDSDVRLDNLSALGESYIAILPHTSSGPTLANNTQIASKRIVAPPSISKLSASMVHLMEQVDPQQLASIVGELDRALPSGDATLTNLSRASAMLAASIASMPGSGRELLGNFQDLLRNAGFVENALVATGPALTQVGSEYNAAIAAAFRMMRTTGAPQSIVDVGKFLDRLRNFLTTSSPDLQVLATTLLPSMRSVAAGARTVDTSQLLASAMQSVPPDGSIILHLVPRR